LERVFFNGSWWWDGFGDFQEFGCGDVVSASSDSNGFEQVESCEFLEISRSRLWRELCDPSVGWVAHTIALGGITQGKHGSGGLNRPGFSGDQIS